MCRLALSVALFSLGVAGCGGASATTSHTTRAGDAKRNCTFNVQNNGPTHAVNCLFDGTRIGGN